jgi:hypothetical protein
MPTARQAKRNNCQFARQEKNARLRGQCIYLDEELHLKKKEIARVTGLTREKVAAFIKAAKRR